MASLPAIEYGVVTHITCMSEYQDALKAAGDNLVVIDFGAKWCGPCRRIAPFYEELASAYTDVVFLKVDVDEAQDVAQSLSVSTLPTFMFLRRGRTIEAFSGADQNRLQTSLDRHKASVAAWASQLAKPTPKTPSAPAPPPSTAPAAAPSATSRTATGRFHQGDVTSAIAAARTQRKPLLVAVESPPPHADSARLESEVWSNADVRAALTDQCVALRLRADTQDARNFSALFPVLAFPFIYLINPLTGAPFTALPGFTAPAALMSHISAAVATLSFATSAPALASAPVAAPVSVAKAPVVAPAAVIAPETQASNVPASLDSPATMEAEKTRLMKKLVEVRAAKEQAAKVEERERELRRVQEAKETQKAKEVGDERRKQLAIEKAGREREEDEKAKARIREQIRLDRLERTKGSAPAAVPIPAAAQAPLATSPASVPIAPASILAMLQVRLLDGSLVKFELPAAAPMSEVRAVLSSKHNQRGGFSLLTPYPRRVYTSSDESRTLAELRLTGAVTLIVTLPEGAPAGGARQATAGGATGLQQGWGGYLWSWLTWTSPPASPVTASHAPTPTPAPVRQVRTLHDQRGSEEDEDRKTWNGNSTQQM